MKKAKILSAFLSFTLGMTAFTAVPVTVSAAESTNVVTEGANYDPVAIKKSELSPNVTTETTVEKEDTEHNYVTTSNLVPDITTTTTVIENNEDVVKECTAKVKFAFLDYFSGISIDGLDITVSKDGTEIFSFNTSDTPEIIKDFSYSASMNTSAAYTLEIKGLPEKYGYENNSIRKGIFLNAGHDGKIYDEITMIARQEYGSTDPIYPEDPTFGFYKKVFNFNVEDEKKIPFSNTNNIKVTATVDTPKAEIIETNEKYIVLKADEPCSGTLTVTDESGRTITAAFEIKSSQSIVTGRTTAPITRTTTTTTTTKTTTSTITHTEPLKGDANCDGDMNMADAVLIMQSIANPEKFGINGADNNHITEQGMKNADITGVNDGVTNADALAIQKKLLGF